MSQRAPTARKNRAAQRHRRRQRLTVEPTRLMGRVLSRLRRALAISSPLPARSAQVVPVGRGRRPQPLVERVDASAKATMRLLHRKAVDLVQAKLLNVLARSTGLTRTRDRRRLCRAKMQRISPSPIQMGMLHPRDHNRPTRSRQSTRTGSRRSVLKILR